MMKALLSYQRVLFLAVPVLLIGLLSCGEQEEQHVEPNLTHTLQKVEEYEIPIDSVTASNFFHYQYYAELGNEYFTMLNRITQEIQFYNLNSKALEFTIPLHFQGPNSVSQLQGLFSGYHIHNLDSIFVLNRNTGKLYIVNDKSERIADYSIVDDKANPSSVLGPFARPLIKNGQVYLINNEAGIKPYKRNKNYRSDFASIMNLSDARKEHFLSYPEVYTKGKWGDFLHRKSWAVDHEKGKVIVSYPIDPNLYEYNLEGELVNQYRGNNSNITQPKSMTRKQRSSMEEQNKYFLAQDRYGLVFRDPVRKIYLRDSHTGLNMDNPGAQKFKSIRKIVILDDNVQKIGEYELPSFDRLKIFFNESGIHRFVPSKNENTLKFERYDLVEIE